MPRLATIVWPALMPSTIPINITVVYDNGESPMSNNAFIGMGAGLVDISDILADGPADIYNLQGICVRRAATSVDGLPAGVYLTRGRKFLIP